MAEGNKISLNSLLSAEGTDFLIRNNGDKVKITSLEGKIVALYFSDSSHRISRRFTFQLIEAYGELSSKGENFEVVFISCDYNEDSFQKHFSKMPWLAIPFSDFEMQRRLSELFEVEYFPHVVVVDGTGHVLNHNAYRVLCEYGSEGYPFIPEKINKMRENAKTNQTLRSLLASSSRDFVISSYGTKVPVSELEGKIVALYFSEFSLRDSRKFTSILAEMYRKLSEKGDAFVVVQVFFDANYRSFNEGFANMPWLAIPYHDFTSWRIWSYFEHEVLPALVVIGSDGKTLHANAVQLVEEHGAEAYPFSPKKLKELEEKEKARKEVPQSLESLLVLRELDYVIREQGAKVPVSDLVGKTILLYFSADWFPPCHTFLPKLIDSYHKIKDEHADAFEVIFVSSDKDQNTFDDFFATMPWLALPFGDKREKSLSLMFKISDIPSFVVIGPTGKTVTKEAGDLIADYGADAYPFTDERIDELEIEEMRKGLPEKVNSHFHEEHQLLLTQFKRYHCDNCEEDGSPWAFYCEPCHFALHPHCALLEDDKEKSGVEEHQNNNEEHAEADKQGSACNREVCNKV